MATEESEDDAVGDGVYEGGPHASANVPPEILVGAEVAA